MKMTTLNNIRKHHPCSNGWQKLLAGLGKTTADDEPLSYLKILETNGFDDALWACRAESQYDRDWRMFAVWCVRQIQHLTKDQRSLDAIDVAERFAIGNATQQELDAARAAAGDAARAAAGAAARAAAGAAARAAARAAAGAAAWAAARDAARAAQKAKFVEIISI